MLFLQRNTRRKCLKTKQRYMAEHNDFGKWGEDMAAKYLEGRGYVVFDRDWRVGNRDLDIVARSGDSMWLVFVEVKTRRMDGISEPEDSVDIRKQRNLAVAANIYLKSHTAPPNVRFDIITVIGSPTGESRIEHIEDAFNPMLIL